MRLLSKNSEDKPPAWTQGDEELKVKNVNLHYLETLQKHLGILFPIPYQNLFFFFNLNGFIISKLKVRKHRPSSKNSCLSSKKGPPSPPPAGGCPCSCRKGHCYIRLKIFLLSSSFLLNIKYVSFALIILVPRLCLLCRRKHNKTIIQSYEGGHLFSDVFRSRVNTDIKGRGRGNREGANRGNREGANDSLCFEPHGWWLTACPSQMQEKWVGFLQGSDLWPHLPGRRKTPSSSSFCWSELRKLPSAHPVHWAQVQEAPEISSSLTLRDSIFSTRLGPFRRAGIDTMNPQGGPCLFLDCCQSMTCQEIKIWFRNTTENAWSANSIAHAPALW